MVKLVQIGFLAGALVFSFWVVAKDKKSPVSPAEEEYVGEVNEDTEESVGEANENTKESFEEAKTEVEGVGKCPHCGVKTADVEREDTTNPKDVAAQVSKVSKSRKKPKKPSSKAGSDAVR